jgi:hypothetical protein
MPIDVHTEHLVPLDEYVRLRPPGRNGKRMHKSTGYRHVNPGVRGVKLEIVCYGAKTYTSKEAISRFVAALTRAREASTERSGKPLQGHGTGSSTKAADRIFG